MISYLAALLAAVTNATSNAVNRKAAREAPGRDQFGPGSAPPAPRERRERLVKAAGRW